jgi:hypothetical protein
VEQIMKWVIAWIGGFAALLALAAAVPAAENTASAPTQIDAAWELVVGSDPLERTAAEDLATIFAGRYQVVLAQPIDVSQFKKDSPAIVIGTVADNPLIAAENARTPFVLNPAEPESYALSYRHGMLYVVGQSPKGAMNGVYRLDDKRTLDVGDIDEHASPAFHFRVGGHKMNQHPPAHWSDNEQARYYARHYINVVWGEKQGPPMPLAARRKYGLGLMVELRFPPVDSAWLDDPAHASAVYHLSAKNKWRVVSPFDPAGREAYARGYEKLLQANPDTRILYAVFADYNAIPDEKSVRASDGQAFGHTRPEAMKQILGIMKQVIGQRDILPVAWLWHGFFGHDQDEEHFMKELAALGYGALYNEHGNKDDWIIRRDNFNATALATGADGRTAYGDKYVPLVSAGGACESINPVIGLPLPDVAATKIRRIADLGVKQFAIWWSGYEGWVYQANNEVVSELIWNPRAFDPNNPRPFDPQSGDGLIRHVAERDFGKALAPGVLEFWRLLDRAVVSTSELYQPPEKLPPADQDGLHIYDWYQRMGTFTEAIFGGGYPVPLTPGDLAARKDADHASWRTNPRVLANYAAVLKHLDEALTQIESLTGRKDTAPAVAQRLKDMQRWTALYRRLLTTQYNYLRGVTVLFDHAGEGIESEAIRRALAPIARDEIDNDRLLIDLLPGFEPNMNIRSNQELVWADALDTRQEIAVLRQKIAAMRIWLDRRPNLAQHAAASASSSENGQLTPERAVDGDGGTRWGSEYTDRQWFAVDLGQVRTIDTLVLRWNAAYGKEYDIEVARDRSGDRPWRSVYHTDRGHGGVEVITLGSPVEARHIRLQFHQRGTGWGYSLQEFEAYGPAEQGGTQSHPTTQPR